MFVTLSSRTDQDCILQNLSYSIITRALHSNQAVHHLTSNQSPYSPPISAPINVRRTAYTCHDGAKALANHKIRSKRYSP